MSYLTQFRVNTARAGARRLLSSPQILHAAVLASFPEAPAEGDRVLWRLDRENSAKVLLYLVSPAQPDLTHLVEQAGWPAAVASGTLGWRTFRYAPFLDRLAKGSAWAFRLTANPVHYVRNKDEAPKKRTAHLTAHHQLGWLLERQDRAGFQVLPTPAEQRLLEHGDEHQVIVRDRRDLSFSKRQANRPDPSTAHQRRSGPLTLTTVTYDGRLEVTDPDALRRVLTGGLGKAKAYGCGLMTLAPLR